MNHNEQHQFIRYTIAKSLADGEEPGANEGVMTGLLLVALARAGFIVVPVAAYEACVGVAALALDGGHMSAAFDEAIELVRLLGITRQECREYLGYAEGDKDMFTIEVPWVEA